MSTPLHLYDKLLQFTLFQGMSHADLMGGGDTYQDRIS